MSIFVYYVFLYFFLNKLLFLILLLLFHFKWYLQNALLVILQPDMP